ncbi:MAG: hypothetical protein Q8N23_28245 [Archangium sp.]|nr:hypothetical protein [Archangium sp.]
MKRRVAQRRRNILETLVELPVTGEYLKLLTHFTEALGFGLPPPGTHFPKEHLEQDRGIGQRLVSLLASSLVKNVPGELADDRRDNQFARLRPGTSELRLEATEFLNQRLKGSRHSSFVPLGSHERAARGEKEKIALTQYPSDCQAKSNKRPFGSA